MQPTSQQLLSLNACFWWLAFLRFICSSCLNEHLFSASLSFILPLQFVQPSFSHWPCPRPDLCGRGTAVSCKAQGWPGRLSAGSAGLKHWAHCLRHTHSPHPSTSHMVTSIHIHFKVEMGGRGKSKPPLSGFLLKQIKVSYEIRDQRYLRW